MRYLFMLLLLITCVTCASAETGRNWSPWYKLDDGGLNGIEFSHKNDCPPGGTATCTHRWRFNSNYETPVVIEYTISWDAFGPREKSERVKLQAGINESAVFTVSGTALDEVTVRLIADKEALSEARKEVTAEIKRQEAERRRLEETARQAELARKAEQERQEKLASAAAMPYKSGEPAEVTRYRDELERQREAARQAILQQREAERRDEERLQEERAERRRERAERAEQERQQQEQEDQQRRDKAEADESFKRALHEGLSSLTQSVNSGMQTYNNAVQAKIDADNYAREKNERQAREAREAQERLNREQRDAQERRNQEAKDRREAEERERARQAREEKARNDKARQDAGQNFNVAMNSLNNDSSNGGSGNKRDTSHCMNANYLTVVKKTFATPGSGCDGYYYGSIKNISSQTLYCVWAFEKHGVLDKNSGGGEYVKPGGAITSGEIWTCGGAPSDTFKYVCTSNADDDNCRAWVGDAFK
jgi:hypothetical protein